MNYRENYTYWLENKNIDNETKLELEAISGNDDEIKFRFSKRLEFGTAGLRGTMKAGLNAMNVYTVAQATQGFADLINKETDKKRFRALCKDHSIGICCKRTYNLYF